MAQAVKISDLEYQAVREAAALNSRSLSGQAEHWIRIGRAVERDPSIAYSRIEQALRGLLPLRELDGDEQEAFFDHFAEKMEQPSESEAAFYADREKRGLGVGLDEAGRLAFSPNRQPR